jgi:hypothetical protein
MNRSPYNANRKVAGLIAFFTVLQLLPIVIRSASAVDLNAPAVIEEEKVQAQQSDHKAQTNIRVERIERAESDETAKPHSWLGLATEEAPEALNAQLGLEAGVGLVVTYVTPESPAAKAGFQKNDLLISCDGQSLVHPAQFRKLIRVRKEGDPVKLVYYRAGKKDTASALLAARPADLDNADDFAPDGAMRELQRQLHDLPVRDALREQLEVIKKSFRDAHVDQEKIRDEVRHSVDEARKAVRNALKSAPEIKASLEPLRRKLEEFARSGWDNTDSSVTVRNSGSSSRSIVRTDDSGTIVIVANPKPRLTAHDKEGKLLFDGEIETPEQRAKVPQELWTRVKPLLGKLDAEKRRVVEEENEDEK